MGINLHSFLNVHTTDEKAKNITGETSDVFEEGDAIEDGYNEVHCHAPETDPAEEREVGDPHGGNNFPMLAIWGGRRRYDSLS